MSLSEKSTGWKIRHSLWVLISFIFLMHWASVLFAGFKAKKKEWIFLGVGYALPVILLFFVLETDDTAAASTLENVVIGIFLLSWMAAIITSFIIRVPYLNIIVNESPYSPSNAHYKAESTYTKRVDSPMLKDVFEIRKEIYDLLQNQTNITNGILSEIEPVVEKYISNIKKLIEQETKLEKTYKQAQANNYSQKIEELLAKMSKTSNHALKAEYETTIEKYRKLIDSYTGLSDQIELTKLKIDSSIASLRQIKMDMLKLSQPSSTLNEEEFFNSLELKSVELSTYVDYLDENSQFLLN